MMQRIVSLTASVLIAAWTTAALAAASDTGEAVPRERYANRAVLPDPRRPGPALTRPAPAAYRDAGGLRTWLADAARPQAFGSRIRTLFS
jgi:hypothetical protein